MIPKSGKSPADSRKSVGIHEFAALARSSLNGNKLRFVFVLFSFEILQLQRQTPLTSITSLMSRYFTGSEGPCDEAHLPGSGPGGTPHRVERLAQTCGPLTGHPLPLQLLLPPEWRREGGPLCCRYFFLLFSIYAVSTLWTDFLQCAVTSWCLHVIVVCGRVHPLTLSSV